MYRQEGAGAGLCLVKGTALKSPRDAAALARSHGLAAVRDDGRGRSRSRKDEALEDGGRGRTAALACGWCRRLRDGRDEGRRCRRTRGRRSAAYDDGRVQRRGRGPRKDAGQKGPEGLKRNGAGRVPQGGARVGQQQRRTAMDWEGCGRSRDAVMRPVVGRAESRHGATAGAG